MPRIRSHAQASGTVAPAASAQPSQAPVGTWRRRTRKKASSAASSAGASRQSTSRRMLHSGTTLRSATTPLGCACQSGRTSPSAFPRRPASSRAETVRSAARPSAVKRARDSSAPGVGPSSPLTCSSAPGSPARSISPCSETVNGSARRAHWAVARWRPGSSAASARAASSTVRTKPIGGWSRPLDHGTTQGLRDFADARSPSTSTPSISDGSALRAQARAPAAPPEPPEVDTSTSVRRRSRPISCGRPGSSVPSASLARVRKMRASSSSAAVPESSASPGEAAESRCASTTIRRGESPGRIPSTVSISASPSIVRPVVVSRRTSMPEASNKPATRSASARSPLEPGRRSGNAAPSSSSESRARSLPYARAGSKASATARVRTGEGRLCNENATTNTAMSAGRNAVL